MKKLWGGRFGEKTARSVEAFTESVSFDRRLARHDIEGSIAHASMLGRQGIIPKKDSSAIIGGLKSILADIEKGSFRFREDLEDVHMNIEAALTDRIGPAGGRLHTARSRNDQIALDLRLYLRAETKAIISLINSLERALLELAEKNMGVVMPGYTHLQRAQPVLLSHHLLAYCEMLERDKDRFSDCLKRINVLPLGSGALAGTTLPIDRAFVAKALGFDRVARNSMDAVSDRDFVIEFTASAGILAMHLSRLAEEMVLWSSGEFSFVTLPDAFTTGSSLMPQKKNPDVAELVRGKTGRVYGNLFALLTIMKALPLAYNRDMQEDKPPLFDTVDTVKACLSVLAEMMPLAAFNRERMAETSGEGYSTATDMAEYLVRKGMPFRKAHEVVGSVVRFAVENKMALSEIPSGTLKGFSSLFDEDVFDSLFAGTSVEARTSEGGTSPRNVRREISRMKKLLGK